MNINNHNGRVKSKQIAVANSTLELGKSTLRNLHAK